MKIKSNLIIGIVLLVFILSAGIVYGQGNLYSDPQGRFSFNLPAGWKAATPYNSSQAAYFTYSVQQGTVGELIIMIEELPFSASIDQYAAAAEENGFKQLPGYKPGTQLPATIFSLPALKKNFTFSPQTGLTLQAEAYIFISGNSAYTILLDILPDYFAQVEPGFAQAVVSFKVQSGVPVTVQPVPQPAPSTQPTPIIPTPTQPTPVPCPTIEPTTPPPSSSDIGGAPPVPSAPVTPAQPVVPSPSASATGMTIYMDSQGRFSIPIPAGSTTAQTTEIGVVLDFPGGVGIVAMYTQGEQYVQGMVAQIKPNHQFHGQSQLQAGNRQALVELYSKVNPQDNVNYATVVVTYPGTSFMIIVTIPADKYNQAQTWILEMIKGTSIR
ncbi:MAG: hypothetical protein KAW42_04025 [Candidatus Atribacteria bacterium]|jgi:hypothetical protein|nr:hypothetical protein [Candidatus Atribacteria bacterium]MCK4309128.1 hypothetical protein [Candidatus Atribacteria bacterium]